MGALDEFSAATPSPDLLGTGLNSNLSTIPSAILSSSGITGDGPTPGTNNNFVDGTAPDSILDGQLTAALQHSGTLYNGKTLFDNSQTGFILGVNNGTVKFFIGNPTSYMNWDGSSLTVTGTITGNVFQTATSGQRIRIVSGAALAPSQAANSLILVNASGNQILQFGSDVSNSTLSVTPINNNVTALLVANDVSLILSNPLVVFTVANASSSAANITALNNGTGVVASFSKALSVSTHFKKYISLDGTIFWTSDGTTPNGNLSGTAGDICLNGASNQLYYCTGTTVWTTPAGIVRPLFSSIFENTARFSTTLGTGGDSITFVAGGALLVIDVGGAAPGFAKLLFKGGGLSTLGGLYGAGGQFRTKWQMTGIDPNAATRYSAFCGFGQPTVAVTGHTFTDKHIGFKMIYGGSSISLYATCADGSTETATLLVVINGQDDVVDLHFIINSSSSIDFYYNKNNSGWSAATNIAANIPTSVEQNIQWSFATDNVNRGGNMTFLGFSFI